MKRLRNLAFAALVLGVTMSVAVVNVPAQAACCMTVTHEITVPGLIRHRIDVHLPMNQYDALGYIVNGARIEVECWGDDPIGDDSLSRCPDPYRGGTVTYSGSQLMATPDGVHLTIINLYEFGSALDEDYPDGDEIYIKARWIDGDGYILNARSSVVSGSY